MTAARYHAQQLARWCRAFRRNLGKTEWPADDADAALLEAAMGLVHRDAARRKQLGRVVKETCRKAAGAPDEVHAAFARALTDAALLPDTTPPLPDAGRH